MENNTTLKKISVGGGGPITLALLPGSPRGATWLHDTNIVVATNATGLLLVPAAGGEPRALTTPDKASGELAHVHPFALPGRDSVLFTVTSTQRKAIALLNVRTKRHSTLIHGGTDARYLLSGHLLYAASGGLWAVRFDLPRGAVVGEASAVVEDVLVSSAGIANADTTAAGTLLYVPDLAGVRHRTVVWIDRRGNDTPMTVPPRDYASLRLSPDGTLLALETRDQRSNIWLWNLRLLTLTPLTFNGGMAPVWTPSGEHLVFATTSGAGAPNLFRRMANGTGQDERLTTSTNVQVPTAITPDGRFVVSVERRPQTGTDIVRVILSDLAADTKSARTEALVEGPFTEQNGEVAPNGRFLAYESNESGVFEIYVRPYPQGQDGVWRVSIAGGTRPMWTRGGRELVYLDASNRFTIVPVESAEPPFRWGRAITLPTTADSATAVAWRTYDVSPDGQRFFVLKDGVGKTTTPGFVVMQNWLEELKAKVP